MRDEFKQYIISLYKDIPQEVYEGLLSVFCLGVVFCIAFKGMQNRLPVVISPSIDRIRFSCFLLYSHLQTHR